MKKPELTSKIANMIIQPFFRYCPNCREDTLDFRENKHYQCRKCNWEYFHNTATAAGAVLFCGNRILMITRGHEPGMGKLDIPGGFVDPGESAEEACVREVKEEIGIELKHLQYYKSYSNLYPYKGVQYTTCDIIFWTILDFIPEDICNKEVLKIQLCDPCRIDNNELAFDSTKALIRDIGRINPLKK